MSDHTPFDNLALIRGDTPAISPRDRFARLLRDQGHIPSADPEVDEVYKLLDEHYEQVVADIDHARDHAAGLILSDLGNWRRSSFPAWPTKTTQLVGWVDPQIIVRDDGVFPTHHTQQAMADYAADTVDDLDSPESSSLGLHVSIHSHWNGHVAEVTTNGRHRAAIYRACRVPLVQCNIEIPRNGLRQFIPDAWTDREDRLMGWLLSQGLISRFTHPHDPAAPQWGVAEYSVGHGSPIPWLLGLDCPDPVDELPNRIAELEDDFGPIPDARLDPLRTTRGVREICGPRAGSLRALTQSLGLTTPPPEHLLPQDPPESIGLPGRPAYEIPDNVLSALLEGLPATTAAFMRTGSAGVAAGPGDPFGRAIAWLWVNGMTHVVVDQVKDLYLLLSEQSPAPSWADLVSGLRFSLPERGLTTDQADDLLGELVASSPEALIAARRPEPDGERARRLAQRDEERGIS